MSKQLDQEKSVSHHEGNVSQGLLDAQPGLAVAAARNQGLAPTEAEVAATTADGARLQQETVNK